MRVILVSLLLVCCAVAQRSLPPTDQAWAPKPAKPPAYRAPHRPHVRLAELRTKHAKERAWREVVVSDESLTAAYVQSPAGAKVVRRFHPETGAMWIVIDGEVRFTVEGTEPFTARRGSFVQVPFQTVYAMEVPENGPALFLEVQVAGARTLYPRDTAPPALPGFDWVPVKLGRRKGLWGEGNRPHVTTEELVRSARPDERGLSVQQIVKDDRFASNFIYGSEKNLAPLNPKDKGHYHPECSEFWFIAAGQMRYAIEGQPLVIASFGDVVYVPPFTYHAPRFHGSEPACRVSLNGYPYLSHLFEDATPPKD